MQEVPINYHTKKKKKKKLVFLWAICVHSNVKLCVRIC